MRRCFLLFLLMLTSCRAHDPLDTGSLDRKPSGKNSQIELSASENKLAELLAPFVASLDRDVWTFRWERAEKNQFDPKSVEDLSKRIGPWADRFYDVNIQNGADTGPGVYVAVDPTATATWGRSRPRLYAIKIKRGTRVLIGDVPEPDPNLIARIRLIANELNCGSSSTDMYDIGRVIGYFRMNESQNCRQAIIDVLTHLSVKALSYGFNSSALPSCRTTGTAISIIDSSAISLLEINGYSEDGNIEGEPKVTPYIKTLYAEVQNDFYSQTLLANLETWSRYRLAFGFFDHVQKVDPVSLKNWKDGHILYCGQRWSIESENPMMEQQHRIQSQTNPVIADILIRISLIYRQKFESSQLKLRPGTPPEFRAYEMRGILNRYKLTRDEMIKIAFAQTPKTEKSLEQDYIDLLKKCLRKYETESFEDVIRGECGTEDSN